MDGNPGAGPGGSSSFTATQQRHAFREKQFIDLDIDYKDFEHFQRQNRCIFNIFEDLIFKKFSRRRQMFDEQLYRSTTYKSFNASQKKRETDQWETHAYANYRSKRAMEREDRERELHSEILKQQQHSRHRTPSLDEMMMHERRNKDYSHITGVSGVVTAIILATLVAFMMESMFRAR
jgi:hypothetical protein